MRWFWSQSSLVYLDHGSGRVKEKNGRILGCAEHAGWIIKVPDQALSAGVGLGDGWGAL